MLCLDYGYEFSAINKTKFRKENNKICNCKKNLLTNFAIQRCGAFLKCLLHVLILWLSCQSLWNICSNILLKLLYFMNVIPLDYISMFLLYIDGCQRILKGQNKMDIPEKMVGNIGYTLRRQAKQNKIQTRCIGYHCTQTNTNSVNKTGALLHATGVNTKRFYAEMIMLCFITVC